METDQDVKQAATTYERQEKYFDGLENKGLISVRVIIPLGSRQALREWASEERSILKNQRVDEGIQIACIDDRRDAE